MAFNMLDSQLDPFETFEMPECDCPDCAVVMDYYPRQVIWGCPVCGITVSETKEAIHDDAN